jgi:hypothetical protein
MVVVATGASFLAAASLSLITFVPFLGPFLGLAVLPLQLLAWMLREIVFQYIGLSSVVSYLKLYRDFSSQGEPARAPNVSAQSLVSDSSEPEDCGASLAGAAGAGRTRPAPRDIESA